MGKKRPAATSHRRNEEPVAAKAEVTAAEIRQDCERALMAMRRGNHTKALRLLKDFAPKCENSGMFHRVSATISAKCAGLIDDPNVKQRHLKSAVESARRAASLAPSSVEYAHYYANLLYEAAVEGKEFEEVIAECERGLAIENPSDPAKDNLTDETVFTAEAKEVRVASMHSELRALIQKSNIASISTWMKSLGGSVCTPGIGDDNKFRLIPLRRTAEDPLEVRYLSGNGNVRRPNEIKKANKTPEERRKEIEVRVAAARLLQQKNEQGGGEESKAIGAASGGSAGSHGSGGLSYGGGGAVASGSGSGSGNGTPKGGERRRHGNSRRVSSYSERKEQVRSFWNSMSSEMMRDLLSIRVSDLKAHFGGFKDGRLACEVLSEAISFGEMNKTWKFWACCHCGERFTEAHAHIQHVIEEHMKSLLPESQSLFPQKVDSEWAEMLLSCSWKPLDLTASVRMLEDQSKSEDPELIGRENCKERIDDCWSDSFSSEEVWESYEEKKSLAENCNGSFWETGVEDGSSKIECKTCDRKEGPKVYDHTNSWPLTDDTERAKLLGKISSLFQVLVTHNCLGVAHLRKVLQYTMSELQGQFPGSQILSCGVDQTPLCICFLGASCLKNIVKFIKDLTIACGLSEYADKGSLDDTSTCSQVSDFEDRVTLDESASVLMLDVSLLNSNAMRDDGGSGNSLEKGGESDSFLSWIYTGSPSADQLTSWSRMREEKCHEGMQLLDILGKEYMQLQNLCDKKQEVSNYDEVLHRLEALCVAEYKTREDASQVTYSSYDSILRKRRDELVEGANEVMSDNKRLELDIISSVLKEAESVTASRFGFEDSYGGVASHLCDLEAGEEDWRSKDYIQQLDNCIENIINNQKEQMSTELCKLDVQILLKLENMHQLELKLGPVSIFDYRFILLPLVKSFMRVHIEELAEKDATEKSDTAREAFLAELALDSKKATGSGNDTSKNTQEKLKDKRRNRDSRRSKDSKVGNFSDQVEDTEQISLAASTDGDLVNRDIVDTESNGDLKVLDDEIRRKIELEAEERKLEETLEYQRRLENEAKQRLLAEQRRRNVPAAAEDALEELGNFSVESGVTVAKQEPIQLKSVCVDNVDSLEMNMRDGNDCSRIGDDEFAGTANRLGSTNSGDHNVGSVPFERRTGKKGKRRSATKVPDGKYQIVSYGKENVKLEDSSSDGMRNNPVRNVNCALNQSVGDGGSKTLRQLQAEEDEEERFQADLKKAVMQSLDTFQARQKLPLVPNSRTGHRTSPDLDTVESETDGLAGGSVMEMDIVGTGLQNEVGEYNCFLNVIIQSLWHLRRFRLEFLRRSTSEHVHVGDPCVICALFDILSALSVASGDARSEPVAPTMLRTALSNLYPESNFFQEGQMNDASEVLAVIFDCLHRSFTSGSGNSDSDLGESNALSWDCSNPSCIAHSLFGMDIFERMNCYNCGLESRHLKYTSFFHNINASALRTMKVMCPENTFDELLNLVEMNHQLACDPEAGGCGKLNHIHHILTNPPYVFTTVLGWQNTCENVYDVKATLAALSTEIDVSILYRGLDPEKAHRLVSVVCYYGQHYHCFAYNHDQEQWMMYDDKAVKVIGSWEEVISMCERGHLQPQVLFYEALN